jgi:hypothetical protein
LIAREGSVKLIFRVLPVLLLCFLPGVAGNGPLLDEFLARRRKRILVLQILRD